MKVIKSYDQALDLVTEKPGEANKFTNCLYLVMMQAIMASNPIVGGMAFLEKEPENFYCKSDKVQEWNYCSKDFICHRKNIDDGFMYKADTSEEGYFNNWVFKFDMLCRSHEQIGMLGSAFFIGVIFGLITIPGIADIFGRKNPFIFTLMVSCVAQLGLIITTDFNWAVFFMILCGITFPGKNVVGLNYLLEFLPDTQREGVMFGFFINDVISYIIMAIFYQYISRNVVLPQVMGLLFSISSLSFVLLKVPESPKFLHSQNRYTECRTTL